MMVLAIMAGCGGNGGDTTTPPANSPASDGGNTSSSGPLKVANVVNGNLGDKSFFDSCEAGLKKLQDDGIITYKTFELGATDADQPKWVSTLDELSADASYDLIVCGTYQLAAILNDCAQKYPDQKYFIYDAEVAQPNVASITFKQNDLGYLVGTAAALMTSSDMEKINPEKVIGFVGGEDGPVINDFLTGFIQATALPRLPPKRTSGSSAWTPTRRLPSPPTSLRWPLSPSSPASRTAATALST